MKELFEWHCMEELEHKSVAFDALINSNPDYFHRIAGMIIATILFMKFSGEGILQFAFQDKQLFDSSYWEDALDFLFFKESILNKGIEKFLRYFSHDFHPSRVDTDHLLEKYNKRDKSAA